MTYSSPHDACSARVPEALSASEGEIGFGAERSHRRSQQSPGNFGGESVSQSLACSLPGRAAHRSTGPRVVPRSDTAHPLPMKEADVLAAEDRLRRAMLASNVAELENLLAPELLFVTHMGQVISREDDLD